MKTSDVVLSTAIRVALMGSVVLLFSCSQPPSREARTIDLAALQPDVSLPELSVTQKSEFNRDLAGIQDSIMTMEGQVIRGWSTRNRVFYNDVMKPWLTANRERLLEDGPSGFINNVAVLGYQLYQQVFGEEFYRWGGDLFDLDQPQEKGTRCSYRYGLDCSGFVTMAYMVAADMGVFGPEDPGGEFTPAGFSRIHSMRGIPDRGGRNGTSNGFRLDTPDLAVLGREVFRVPKDGNITEQQLAVLQPGDLVGRAGHVGMIVEIQRGLYYLESGGYVVPANGYRPCNVEDAIRIFARRGELTIRRALPDRVVAYRNE